MRSEGGERREKRRIYIYIYIYICMYVCEVRSEHVGNKKIFFVIPSYYNELLEIAAYCSNHSKFVSFTLFVIVCIFYVLVALATLF